MDRLRALLGPFGLPPDFVGWAILALGAFFVASAALPGSGGHLAGGALAGLIEPPRRALDRERTRLRFVLSACFVAAFLSLAYIAFYLRGGPRIIDATSYFLQGRALSQGSFTWDVPQPSGSFRGRFLLFSEPNQIGGIFPPGYPMLLAFGFMIGAPMVIGPLLAAALVVVTYFLTRELAMASGLGEHETERAARAATVVSVLTAALRYHTADTMSHGAAALALTAGAIGLLMAWRDAEGTYDKAAWTLLGFAVGGLVSIRPVSALPIVALAAVTLVRAKSPRRLLRVLVFAAPGVLLLLASQRAVAGSMLASTQKAYYAASDGPPGCFRYGFGAGIGCLFEHGDFVKARLENGYGLLAALGTTLRRVRLHLGDVTNFELVTLALTVPVAALARSARPTAARLLLVLVLGQVLAYAPFYFDGSYPGGGARFYADVIPIEHALLVVALASQSASAWVRRLSIALGLGALGFAFHGVHDHVALRERDGGRPMFEPDLIREAHKDHGLLFFDTDHGFNLALQPGVTASHGILAVRLRNDDRDRFLYESLGHPSTHKYVFGKDKSSLEQWVPPSSGTNVFRLESEAEWPPLHQSGGWAEPAWANGTASNDRYLRLIPANATTVATAEIDLLVPAAGRYSIEPTALIEDATVKATLAVVSRGAVVASWEWAEAAAKAPGAKPRTQLLAAKIAELADPSRVRLTVVGGATGLDRVILRKVP